MLTLLQANPTLPADTPYWFVALFGAISALLAWLGAQVWPVLRQRIEAGTQQSIEAEKEERKRRADLEERAIRAQETTADAVSGIKTILSVVQFQIAAIERHLDMDTPPPKLTPRRRTEGERGE